MLMLLIASIGAVLFVYSVLDKKIDDFYGKDGKSVTDDCALCELPKYHCECFKLES